MRTSWVCGMLGLFAVIAIGASSGEAAYCLDARSDAAPRVVSYGDVGKFIRYGHAALPGAALAGLRFPSLAPPVPDAALAARSGPLTYSAIDTSEEALLSGVRVIVRVQLSREAGESELRSIGDELIRRERARRRLNAIAFVYYLRDGVAADACAVGAAVWAPHGNWDATRSVRLGDYTSHQHIVLKTPHRWQERAASVVRSSAVVARPRQTCTADAGP